MQKIVSPLLILLFALLAACGRSTPVFQQRFDPAVYVVQSGDTVYSIAWRYNQDFRDVITWNKLKSPYVIFPGQKLLVRGKPQKHQATKTQVAESSSVVKTQPLKKPRVTAKPAAKPATKKEPTKAKPATQAVVVNSPNKWVWPVKGKLLARFSASSLDRQGIDIKGVEGDNVVASRGGLVVYSGSGMRTYGRLVIIKHNQTFLSAYAYNSKLLVKEGQRVQAGQPIAKVGVSNQGVAKLHFEIRNNGKPVNPLKYLPNN